MTKKSIISKIFYNFIFILLCSLLLVVTGYWLLVSSVLAQETKDDFILTWSANTYVPFDYPGKSLAVYGSLITVAVIPLTKLPISKPTIDLAKLNYNWFLDGEPQINASGENRQDFVFRVTTTATNQHQVSVQIKNKEETFSLELWTDIKIVSPEVILYWFDQEANKPDTIQADGTRLSPGQEGTFVALPYFFNIKNINDLEYQWFFENQTIVKTEKPNLFTLKIAQGQLEKAVARELSIFVENPKNRVQRANDKIEILIR